MPDSPAHDPDPDHDPDLDLAPDRFPFPRKSMIRIMIRSRRIREGLAASPTTA
jgi:hypothetical protein